MAEDYSQHRELKIDQQGNTCGRCLHGVPYEKYNRLTSRTDSLAGFLLCKIRINTPEGRARYLSPNRPACEFFREK